ncbi:hypothetical protein [Spirosoma litoris]
MKILLISCLSLLAISGLTSSAIAQTKEELKTTVSQHHAKVLEHTKALKEGVNLSKSDMEEHTKQVGEHLTKAKEAHKTLDSKLTESEKAKPEHQQVKKQQTIASVHHKALKEEVNKTKPNETKVKEHATKIHEAISKAEEQPQLAHKTGKGHKQ